VFNESAPPVFDVPQGLDFRVAFNADNLDDSADEGISVVRDGVTFTLDDLRLDQGDEQQLEIGAQDMAMENDSDHNVAPTLGYDDVTGANGYEVSVRTSGLDASSTLDLVAKPGQHRLKLDLDAAGDEDAKVTAVVSRTDGDGEVEKAKTRPTKIDGGEHGTISYSDKALRDGKIELDL
jgi:hypothetical protein